MNKITDIEEGLDLIQDIDGEISIHLEKNEYPRIIEILKRRLTVICEINRIKDEQGGIPMKLQSRFKEIFSDVSDIQEKIKNKQGKIQERLKKHEKTKTQNKKFGYKK